MHNIDCYRSNHHIKSFSNHRNIQLCRASLIQWLSLGDLCFQRFKLSEWNNVQSNLFKEQNHKLRLNNETWADWTCKFKLSVIFEHKFKDGSKGWRTLISSRAAIEISVELVRSVSCLHSSKREDMPAKHKYVCIGSAEEIRYIPVPPVRRSLTEGMIRFA